MKHLLDDLIFKFTKNKYKELIEIGRDNLKIYQSDVLALKIFGSACFKVGDIDEAIKYYLKALKLNQNDYEICTNLGLCFVEKDDFENAISVLQNSIKHNSKNKLAFNLLGIAHGKIDDTEKSIEFFKDAIRLDNDYLDANYNLGLTYYSKELFQDCEKYFLRVYRINKDYKEIKIYLGISFRMLKKNELSLNLFKEILIKDPKNEKCHYHIGKIYHDSQKYDDAISKFDTAIKNNSELEEPFNAKGLSFLEKEKFNEALKIFNFVITKFPKSKIGYYNLGILHGRQGKTNEALKYFEKAIEIDPNFADANLSKSNCLLRVGKFRDGWKYYKWRKGGRFLKDKFSLKYSGTRLTSLGNIKNKTILIIYEQGLGDSIQFSRYTKLLLEKKVKVFFLVQKPLEKILSSLDKNIKIITHLKNYNYDFICPLIDLPRLFGTKVNTIPDLGTYIFANNNLVLKWKKKLIYNKFNIGIAWQGNGEKKSFKLNFFKNISKLKNIDLISLQKNYGAEQLNEFKKKYSIKDFSNTLDLNNDFVDTAALIKSMDLVITPCTAVAHLAGALGTRVWLLLQYAPDWRWLEKGKKTNWYRSMKIYRQSKLNDWEGVFKQVFIDLKTIVKK